MSISTNIITIIASTHFNIKLTAQNFPVWRRHVHSTLIGLDLEGFITGDKPAPSKTIADSATTKSNPAYGPWVRQDQAIYSVILGSCSEEIQPLIASAPTAKDAWDRLSSSFASTSRTRIISLKTKLTTNPKGTRSIYEYLKDMRSISDELALVQNPISDEDLMVYILSQLGDEYTPLTAALKARDTPISYPKLFDKRVDFERSLSAAAPVTPIIATANVTQRHSARNFNRPPSALSNRSARVQPMSSSQRHSRSSKVQPSQTIPRSNQFCNYYDIPGHDTRDCRKLAKFLNDNQLALAQTPSSPVVNTTVSTPGPSMWMMDSCVSHHLASCPATLTSVSDYGGPDEILLGDDPRLFRLFVTNSLEIGDLCWIFDRRNKQPSFNDVDHDVWMFPKKKDRNPKHFSQQSGPSRVSNSGDHAVLKKILVSIFLTNFPPSASTQDLWNECNNWGPVSDVYIAAKLSKLGRRFGFVRYIAPIDVDKLIGNLRTVWMGLYHLYADIVRDKQFKVNANHQSIPVAAIPSKSNKGNSNGIPLDASLMAKTFADILKPVVSAPVVNSTSAPKKKIAIPIEDCVNVNESYFIMGKLADPRSIVDLPGLFAKEGFLDARFRYIRGRLGEFLFFGNDRDDPMAIGKVCIITSKVNHIDEYIEVEVASKVFNVHVKEFDTWSPSLGSDDGDSSSSDNSEDDMNYEDGEIHVNEEAIQKVESNKINVDGEELPDVGTKENVEPIINKEI
ncbi:hypothetical protein SSX86_024146 [Deinandra increscens subsp. villosa]|uniref:RRM domain-containing protein n=1 Tax=Deinandra increscens subsp. villosa TaxID=3103831 RepID=A0AAP0CP02_9ASTR